MFVESPEMILLHNGIYSVSPQARSCFVQCASPSLDLTNESIMQ